jgi:class 3 adenylate cyclase/tetratricopeptide (TPR) repeat protein
VDFVAVVDQVIALLRQRGRVAYRTLKRQFQLDDEALDDLKIELIDSQRLAMDEQGTVLVWTGAAEAPPRGPAGSPGSEREQPSLAYTPPYLAEKILTSKSALEGERKQVTVLFADLKGSMELLAERDPEEARHLLDPVLDRMMAAVHQYEGTVNQVMGDGIMALFGAPLAHEDHAVRACYASLRMQETIKQYAAEVQRTHGVPLHIRIGLNAGEVVVRTIGNDLRMDYTAVGQTTHLAARMEQMAMPGAILITPAVLGLVEGFVQVKALGAMPVRGLRDPVEVYEVTGAGLVRSRLQAAAARGLTRFVGRQPELETLQQALTQAQAGHGQVVALVGEAGVGKSRLLAEFGHSHHPQGWRVLESASVSYGTATPYGPVVDLLKRYCHVEERDDPRTIRAKVTGQLLTLDETLHETIPAVLALQDALPADSSFLTLDPPQRRQRTLNGLKRLLLRESQVQPLLLVFEDLHWIDTETQALLDSLVERVSTAQLLLLVTYRPEYQHGWGSKTYYTQLRLDPLPPASADVLLQALLGADPSLASLTRLLIARTAGNPFFLEESVRTLVETGLLVGETSAYRVAQPLQSLQVPTSVQAVLAARIDRLPPEAKHLLQTAAVIGTDVRLALLRAIADVPEEALHRGLARLQAAEFLYEARLFPEREYTFKHALTHEVAYGSLLLERRRVLHAQIVAALEALARERMTEQVEWLTHHAMRGEVWDKALAYCRQAGAKAYAHAALREAVGYFEQALVALQHLPDSHSTREQTIDLRLDLSVALFALGEHRQTLLHLREAETLATALGDQRYLGLVSARLSNTLIGMGDNDGALASGQRALALATALGDVPSVAEATTRLGHVYHTLGDYARALDLLRQAEETLSGVSLRERCGERVGTASPVTVIRPVTLRAFLLGSLAEVGNFTEGEARGEEGVRIAEAAENLTSLIVAYWGVGRLSLRKGDVQKAISVLERGLSLCKIGQISTYFILIAAPLGYAYTLSGRVAEALPLLEQVLEEAQRSGFMYSQALWVTWLSEAYLLADRQQDARALAQSALERSREHKERGHEAWLLRLLGEIAARRDPPEAEQAQRYYRQALALAESLGMRPLLAHCRCGLGTLYTRTGQQELARAELAAAIALYRDMGMTFWLPQAEMVLAQVDA